MNLVRNYVTPNDVGVMADTDSRSINNAVSEAVESGVRRVVIPRINERTGDVFGLHVTNIHVRTNTAVMLNESVENSYFGNIYAANGVDRVISTKSCRARQNSGAELKNVVFENIFYDCRDNANSTAFDFDTNNREHTMKNVIIRNAFIGKAECAVNMKHKGSLNISGLYSDLPSPSVTVSAGAEVIIDGKKYE